MWIIRRVIGARLDYKQVDSITWGSTGNLAIVASESTPNSEWDNVNYELPYMYNLRRSRVGITYQALSRLLGLGDDIIITSIESDTQREIAYLNIRGPRLSLVPEGGECPNISVDQASVSGAVYTIRDREDRVITTHSFEPVL